MEVFPGNLVGRRSEWEAGVVAGPGTTMRDWGLVGGEELAHVVVVSPHLDDAVLGCGRFLAAHPGATVVTMFAGAPATYPDPMTRWDVLAGFRRGDDVLDTRREEDRAALATLRARPVHLDFVEHQYLERDRRVRAEETVDVLTETLRELEPTAVLAPFGLANPDHATTHRACLLVRDRLTEPAWFCYEDTGYKHVPGVLAWRVSRLFAARTWPTPVAPAVAEDDRLARAALACYASQLRALQADWGLEAKGSAPEQLWRLAPPPPGWEPLADLPDLPR